MSTVDKMLIKGIGSFDPEMEGLEERLTSFLEHLQSESRVFERVVYKNKNQHRRCSYFRYLLKVRRDLRLLELAKLEQILASCFQVIAGKKPKQKLHLLECLKWQLSNSGTSNFMERLLGVARLLSQMVEPILKAAIETSTLLARSFFMGFSLTVLALLSRIRVLIQQILLDIVKVFNKVSVISQEKQSIRITEKGIEVFREYYPFNKVFISLDCVWSTNKFILLEQRHETTGRGKDDSLLDASSNISAPRYESIDSFLGDGDTVVEEVDEEDTAKAANPGVILGEDNSLTSLNLEAAHAEAIQVHVREEDHPIAEESADQKPSTCLLPNLGSSPSSTPSYHHTKMGVGSVKRPAPSKPAFVSVKRRATSPSKPENLPSVQITKEAGDEDSFFNLLTGGSLKNSLF